MLRLDFPARGKMPPVAVYYHDSARSDDPNAYHVPGMENETILPPTDNLSDKGRPMGSGRRPEGRERRARRGAGRRHGPPVTAAREGRACRCSATAVRERSRAFSPATGRCSSGRRGLWRRRAAARACTCCRPKRWAEYVLPPQLLTRSPGHMMDWIRACKGGDPSCSDFSISGPYAEWLALAAIAMHVPGKLEWDSKNLRITNNAEANEWVRPRFREGWELKL